VVGVFPTRDTSSGRWRYLVALVACAAAALSTIGIDARTDREHSFAALLAASLVTGWYAGSRPAILALIEPTGVARRATPPMRRFGMRLPVVTTELRTSLRCAGRFVAQSSVNGRAPDRSHLQRLQIRRALHGQIPALLEEVVLQPTGLRGGKDLLPIEAVLSKRRRRVAEVPGAGAGALRSTPCRRRAVEDDRRPGEEVLLADLLGGCSRRGAPRHAAGLVARDAIEEAPCRDRPIAAARPSPPVSDR